MTLETVERTVSEYERYLFVKPGSAIINKRIGEIEQEFNIGYVHMYEGSNPISDSELKNYNQNMKIKACNTYKFAGKPQNLDKLCSSFNNLEIKTLKIKPQ